MSKLLQIGLDQIELNGLTQYWMRLCGSGQIDPRSGLLDLFWKWAGYGLGYNPGWHCPTFFGPVATCLPWVRIPWGFTPRHRGQPTIVKGRGHPTLTWRTVIGHSLSRWLKPSYDPDLFDFIRCEGLKARTAFQVSHLNSSYKTICNGLLVNIK